MDALLPYQCSVRDECTVLGTENQKSPLLSLENTNNAFVFTRLVTSHAGYTETRQRLDGMMNM